MRRIIRALEYLDAILHRDRCPRACAEGHTYAGPCAMARPRTLPLRVRRAVRAFRDYPGRRVVDGGEPGTLVVCGEPHGCGGSGVLHAPDRIPEPVSPEEGTP